MDGVLIFWMVVLILCIGIEVLTLGLTTIWFAAGALVAIFAALLYAPIFVQVILFLAVSLVLLFFTRPIAVKYFNKDRVKTNVESMVGRQAIVTGQIDNVQATGQVTVSGQEWSARSWDDRVQIPVGAVVTVAAISGVKLIVRLKPQPVEEAAGGSAQRAGAPENEAKRMSEPEAVNAAEPVSGSKAANAADPVDGQTPEHKPEPENMSEPENVVETAEAAAPVKRPDLEEAYDQAKGPEPMTEVEG